MIPTDTLRQLAKGKSVLYVEDEEDLRKNMNVYLKKIFSTVVSVSDGKLGLEEFREKNFDIIITDIIMPNFDGVSMLKEIIQTAPHQKIIVLTASTDSCNEINLLEMKNLITLIKPVDHKNLIETIYKTLLK